MVRYPSNAFALTLLSIVSCELLAADDNAEHTAIRAKFTGCVETKAIEYSKSTESADLVFEIAVSACKPEMLEAEAKILTTLSSMEPASARHREIAYYLMDGLRGRILVTIIEARKPWWRRWW